MGLLRPFAERHSDGGRRLVLASHAFIRLALVQQDNVIGRVLLADLDIVHDRVPGLAEQAGVRPVRNDSLSMLIDLLG